MILGGCFTVGIMHSGSNSSPRRQRTNFFPPFSNNWNHVSSLHTTRRQSFLDHFSYFLANVRRLSRWTSLSSGPFFGFRAGSPNSFRRRLTVGLETFTRLFFLHSSLSSFAVLNRSARESFLQLHVLPRGQLLPTSSSRCWKRLMVDGA